MMFYELSKIQKWKIHRIQKTTEKVHIKYFENQFQIQKKVLMFNCAIYIFSQSKITFHCDLVKYGGFFSRFLAAAFLARNVSQNHFSFSREMCTSSDYIIKVNVSSCKMTISVYFKLQATITSKIEYINFPGTR